LSPRHSRVRIAMITSQLAADFQDPVDGTPPYDPAWMADDPKGGLCPEFIPPGASPQARAAYMYTALRWVVFRDTTRRPAPAPAPSGNEVPGVQRCAGPQSRKR